MRLQVRLVALPAHPTLVVRCQNFPAVTEGFPLLELALLEPFADRTIHFRSLVDFPVVCMEFHGEPSRTDCGDRI